MILLSMPLIAIAGYHSIMDFVSWVHLQVHCHNAIAAVDIGQRIGISAWCGVGIAIPSVSLARADGVANKIYLIIL